MARKKHSTDSLARELREFGLAYPGAHLKSPWPGHLDLAVKDKTFAYLSVDGEPFSISCKLPRSRDFARMLPFTSPTGYGLGKSGWVTASLPKGEPAPTELFRAWIDESYRAQAPKKLVAELDARASSPAPEKVRAGKRAAASRAPPRNTRKARRRGPA